MTDFPKDQHRQGAPPGKPYRSIYPPWELTLKLRKALVSGAIAGGVLLVLSLPYYRLFTDRGHRHGMFFWWADIGGAVPWLAGFWALFSFGRQLAATQAERAENTSRTQRAAEVSRAAARKEAEQREADRRYEEGYQIRRAAREAEEAKQREEREEASRRYAQSLAREQAEKARQRRLTELETGLLRAFAAHSLAADFTGDPLAPALVADFLNGFLPTAPADVGLLRESTNPHVRRIIGDGSRLPAPPALPG